MANFNNDHLYSVLKQREAEGEALIGGYKSSLATAAGQDQQSIDSLRGIYSDPSKFEKSKLGAFASALGAPGGSGRFGDSMNSALSAANDANEYNKVQNLDREEKLAKLHSLEAQLTRQQANDSMGVYDKQTSWMTSQQADRQMKADLDLGNRPAGPRPLNPMEFGPEAPGSDHVSKSMKIYNDYLTNPNQFAGPQGQQMVKDAIEVLKNERKYQSVDAKAAAKPSYGQVAMDKKFGAEISEWYANGGESDYQKQADQLAMVHSKLLDPNQETSGAITGRMPDWANSWLNPGAIDSRDMVGEVVQRNLKNILGAQFTQKEGDNLIARAYNPALDEATNARRVGALMEQMKQAHAVKTAAVKYFEQNGTLEGFNAPMPTMADFHRALENSDSPEGARVPGAPVPNTPPQRIVDDSTLSELPDGQRIEGEDGNMYVIENGKAVLEE